MTEGLKEAVRMAGVVGAGGGGFPTYAKLLAGAEVILINGAECEPLLRVDQQLLRDETGLVIEGLRTLVRACGARRGVIALKAKYKEAVLKVKELISRGASGGEFDVFELGDFYPAGDEHVLVYEALGKIIPEGGLPIQVGVVVANVETAYNVALAMEGRPVVEKFVTVTGAVKNPVTVRVPVGVAIRDLLELAGGPAVAPFAVIEGGPMMGREVDPREPVTKTTKGIIVLPADHPLIYRKRANSAAAASLARTVCMQCRFCTDLCPRRLLGHHLEPHRITRAVGSGRAFAPEEVTQAFLCVSCGVCDYFACPHGISPRLIFNEIKKILAQKKVPNPHRAADLQPEEMRRWRKIPSQRLLVRLGLEDYEHPAPLIADRDSLMREVKTVTLPLKQAAGAVPKPVVRPGERVEKGQVIAEVPAGSLGVPLHASISGVVRKVSPEMVIEKVSKE